LTGLGAIIIANYKMNNQQLAFEIQEDELKKVFVLSF